VAIGRGSSEILCLIKKKHHD